MSCTTCHEPADGFILKCSGLCNGLFHISCLSTSNTHYKNALITSYFNKIPNLRWLCDNCIPLETDPKQHIISELTNRLTDIKAFADNLLTTLNSGNLTTQISIGNSTPQRSEQNGLNAASSNGSFTTAASQEDHLSPTKSSSPMDLSGSSSTLLNTNITTRGKRFRAQTSPGLSPKSKQKKMAEEQPVSLADLIAKPKVKKVSEPIITMKTNMVRSIYITPFDPSTEPSHIMSHLESNENLKHIVPNIVCTKLVKKNQRLSFVSFKLDVPRHHFDIVINPEIWQMNGKDEVTLKEFVDKRGHGSTENANNPFSKPVSTQNRVKKQQPPRVKKSVKHQQTKPARSKSNGIQHHYQRQNFQHRCQKQCCSQPRPQCYRCNDHYEENRYGHRQLYRR